MSIYVACAEWFVFWSESIFMTTFLFTFFFFSKFSIHLCHVVSWCTLGLAHMPIFLFRLYLDLSNSCICVCHLVYALPSSFTFKLECNHRHLHMYIFDDFCVMTAYKLNVLSIIRFYVPVSRGFTRCLHTCDPMFKGLYFNIHKCLCFLWILTDHVHIKNVQLCAHLPSPYVSFSRSFWSVSIPSTYTRAHVWIFTLRLFNPNKKNTCLKKRIRAHRASSRWQSF